MKIVSIYVSVLLLTYFHGRVFKPPNANKVCNTYYFSRWRYFSYTDMNYWTFVLVFIDSMAFTEYSKRYILCDINGYLYTSKNRKVGPSNGVSLLICILCVNCVIGLRIL